MSKKKLEIDIDKDTFLIFRRKKDNDDALVAMTGSDRDVGDLLVNAFFKEPQIAELISVSLHVFKQELLKQDNNSKQNNEKRKKPH